MNFIIFRSKLFSKSIGVSLPISVGLKIAIAEKRMSKDQLADLFERLCSEAR